MDTETRPEHFARAPLRHRWARRLGRALAIAAMVAVAVLVLFAAARMSLHRTLDATTWDAIDLGR
jgi:hypothetical protein